MGNRLAGKVAVVTGGSQGLGLRIGVASAGEGADVVPTPRCTGQRAARGLRRRQLVSGDVAAGAEAACRGDRSDHGRERFAGVGRVSPDLFAGWVVEIATMPREARVGVLEIRPS
jgi:NAD(P)-dependent dehydrogenase (short-subunit alcohol dehydrogenase family)